MSILLSVRIDALIVLLILLTFLSVEEWYDNVALFPICQFFPSRLMLTGKILYLFGFKFLITSLPDINEISYSEELPPIKTATLIFLLIYEVFLIRAPRADSRSTIFS